MGEEIFKTKQSRECEDAFEGGVGLSIHTPHVSYKQQPSSPQTSKFQVYSRKRYFQKKKLQLGCADGPITVTNTDTQRINSTSPHHQHEQNGKYGPAQEEIISITEKRAAQKDQLDAEIDNNYKQEAAALWEMAKAMGLTCRSMPRNFVSKIMEMEERDENEAQRLGSKRSLQ